MKPQGALKRVWILPMPSGPSTTAFSGPVMNSHRNGSDTVNSAPKCLATVVRENSAPLR